MSNFITVQKLLIGRFYKTPARHLLNSQNILLKFLQDGLEVSVSTTRGAGGRYTHLKPIFQYSKQYIFNLSKLEYSRSVKRFFQVLF